MNTFASILDTPSDEIERPKPLPGGTYICSVKGQPNQGKAKTGTEFAEFTLQILGAHEDVDPDALAECLKGKALIEKTIKATYYVTDDAIWRLKEFLDHCGVESGPGISIRQRMSGAAGSQVNAFMKQKPSQDGTFMRAELVYTAPVA